MLKIVYRDEIGCVEEIVDEQYGIDFYHCFAHLTLCSGEEKQIPIENIISIGTERTGSI
jgi:hypothetical protein